MIQNPILPGFYPDPSIVRSGEDYYIATSTFQWFPGVSIHHSRDLIHWRLVGHALTRRSQLDLTGVPDSGGVWAPCLSFCDGLFYLVYTNTTHMDCENRVFENMNYMVTAEKIEGPWSDPVFLNKSGFDPSLFHDKDGKKWLLNLLWKGGRAPGAFGGICLQEYLPAQRALTGEPRLIFAGTPLGCTEGPHLLKKDGYYYLVTAEGGTSYEHAVTVARSRKIEGPYEVDPQNPMLSTRDNPSHAIQKAGHASLVRTSGGQWYLAHLGARPLTERGRCPLGRETFLQKIDWESGGWPRIDGSTNRPQVTCVAPGLTPCPWPAKEGKEDFEEDRLGSDWQFPRAADDSVFFSLSERKGFLRILGGEELSSRGNVSLAAKRQTDFSFSASTLLEFNSPSPEASAGLTYYYDTKNYYYLRLSRRHETEWFLDIEHVKRGSAFSLSGGVVVPDSPLFLRMNVNRGGLKFYWSTDAEKWFVVGPELDASLISDEGAGEFGFTGAFSGICCVDVSGAGTPADFKFFRMT